MEFLDDAADPRDAFLLMLVERVAAVESELAQTRTEAREAARELERLREGLASVEKHFLVRIWVNEDDHDDHVDPVALVKKVVEAYPLPEGVRVSYFAGMMDPLVLQFNKPDGKRFLVGTLRLASLAGAAATEMLGRYVLADTLTNTEWWCDDDKRHEVVDIPMDTSHASSG